MYSSIAKITAISTVRISQVVVYLRDSYRTTVALFLRRRTTAIAAICTVAEVSEYKLTLPTLVIAFASLIAYSRSTITTRGPRLA
jgi:hypothetical protein